MKVLIVDDEEQARETLSYYLGEFFPDLEIIGKCGNITDAGKIFYEAKPDLVFLDITMPSGTGFDLAKRVDFSETFVVFVTAHAEYAIDAIKMNAFDYLLKPVHIDELTRVIAKARISSKNMHGTTIPVEQKIKIKHEGKIMVLSPDDFIYARSEGNYTNIYLTEGRKIVISRNIKKIEEEYFAEFPFFRTHQSYIVNLRKVIQFDSNEILLETKIEVPLSKLRYDEFKETMKRI